MSALPTTVVVMSLSDSEGKRMHIMVSDNITMFALYYVIAREETTQTHFQDRFISIIVLSSVK